MGATAHMPKKTKRDDSTVKIASELARQARLVCAVRNIGMAELLSELLSVPLGKEYEQAKKQLVKEDK